MSSSFTKLPISFDPERLQQEVSQFVDADWLSHPIEAVGNTSLPLISVGGTNNIDYAISGPMRQTHHLERCPYLQQVLQAFDAPLSRCRLIRQILQPDEACVENSAEELISEQSYHYFRRRLIYVPIVTDSRLQLVNNETRTHMTAGEAWAAEPRVPHKLIAMNSESADEIDAIVAVHLVIETKGSAHTESSDNLAQENHLSIEPYTFKVLTPPELSKLLAFMLVEIRENQVEPNEFAEQIRYVDLFQQRWQQVFERFGHHSAGELAYQDLLHDFQEQIVRKVSKQVGKEGKYAMAVIRSILQTAPAPKRTLRKQIGQRIQLQRQKKNAQTLAQQETFCTPEFDRPLFIVSAPRAGSTLLFETLRHFPELWSIAEESHELIEDIPSLHPAAHDYHSNGLTAADVTPEITALLRQRFAQQLQNRDGEMYIESSPNQRMNRVRFLEKTPKNALRIPFLKAVFPEARFLVLYREPGENISSMIEGWRARRFIAYRPLPGWPHRDWSFLLVPEWQSVINRPIAEIAAHQWQMANATILQDIASLPRSDWSLVYYKNLVQQPKQAIHQIAQFAELEWDEQIEQRVSQKLPVSSMTMTAPSAEKWRKNSWQLADILPGLESTMNRQIALMS